MRARLIVNPEAGRGVARRLGPEIERCLAALGLDFSTTWSASVGDVAVQAEAACRAGSDPVIVAGGDGTVCEGVNGVMRAGAGTCLGIIPVGTGNDLIKAAGLPRHWRAACGRVVAGSPRRVDVGRCNEHYFVNGVGAGFDAEVARAARSIRRLRGNLVYGAALAQMLVRGVRTPHVTITCDEGLCVHADGEILYDDARRLEIELLPQALSLLV